MPERSLEIKYTPENINHQLTLGKSWEELAGIFGHKNYKTLDIFMCRRGYAWNREKQVYEIKELSLPRGTEDISSGPKKVHKVLGLFEEGKDPKEVAKEVGFKNHRVLAKHMKKRGYIWNPQKHNYEQQVGELSQGHQKEEKPETSSGNEEDVIQLSMQNKDKLEEMLGSNCESLPRKGNFELKRIIARKQIYISGTMFFSGKINTPAFKRGY